LKSFENIPRFFSSADDSITEPPAALMASLSFGESGKRIRALLRMPSPFAFFPLLT
jgi:hypothetical protein